MMNVQSVNCQPIRHNHMNATFAGKGEEQDYEYVLNLLKNEKDQWEPIAHNNNNKMLSAIGTLGVSAIAGALSFCTFKTVAPKGFQTAKSLYNKVADLSLVKKSVDLVKKGASAVGSKVVKMYKGIKPKSTLGKVKKYVEKKVKLANKKLKPVMNKVTTKVKDFAEKHNINKAWFKSFAKNAGATAVAIPAAITAANADLTGGAS